MMIMKEGIFAVNLPLNVALRLPDSLLPRLPLPRSPLPPSAHPWPVRPFGTGGPLILKVLWAWRHLSLEALWVLTRSLQVWKPCRPGRPIPRRRADLSKNQYYCQFFSYQHPHEFTWKESIWIRVFQETCDIQMDGPMDRHADSGLLQSCISQLKTLTYRSKSLICDRKISYPPADNTILPKQVEQVASTAPCIGMAAQPS